MKKYRASSHIYPVENYKSLEMPLKEREYEIDLNVHDRELIIIELKQNNDQGELLLRINGSLHTYTAPCYIEASAQERFDTIINANITSIISDFDKSEGKIGISKGHRLVRHLNDSYVLKTQLVKGSKPWDSFIIDCIEHENTNEESFIAYVQKEVDALPEYIYGLYVKQVDPTSGEECYFLLKFVGENYYKRKDFTKSPFSVKHNPSDDGKLYIYKNSEIEKEYNGEYDHLLGTLNDITIVQPAVSDDHEMIGNDGKYYKFATSLFSF
jgi:hypothetical protein